MVAVPGSRAMRALAAGALVLTVGLWALGLALTSVDGGAAGAAAGIGAVAFVVVGVLVTWQRPGNRLGPLFCLTGFTVTLLGSSGAYADFVVVHHHGWLAAGRFAAWFSDLLAIPAVGLFTAVLPQLFPTGRALSRRWRYAVWCGVGYIVFGAAGNAVAAQQLESVPALANPYAVPSAHAFTSVFRGLSGGCGLVAVGAGIATLVLRWRRAEGDERQQLRWFLAAVVPLPLAAVLHDADATAGEAAFTVLFLLVAGALGVAVLRYRLYDLQLVIRLTLAYAGASTIIAAIYVGVVAAIAGGVRGGVPLGVHAFAAVVAAAAFHPLRAWVQGVVDRFFFGDRAHPYDAVARLSRRLELAETPDNVLPGVVQTIAEALRLPYVAVELSGDGEWVLTAAHGSPAGETVSFPMTYQTEVVGRLQVCARARNEPLDPADERLLGDLARQAGVAAHAVRTTTALRRSRAELVAAREEERRRLRRDLHDGLGPTLAGVTLGLHAATTKIPADPLEAQRLLADIESQVEEAVTDVRRLVYGLRPPALDEFGLVRAVQLHAARIDGTPGGLRVIVEAPPEELGPLPAAVEAAAYRIATEALTNVARHARARTCTVRFSLNGALELEISDDGQGFVPGQRRGVGLTAMQERAAELGGTLAIDTSATGARIRARLPVAVAL